MAASAPGFAFDLERLIEDEDLMRIGQREEAHWKLREQLRVLPRIQFYRVVRAGGSPGREVSHARSVRARHGLTVEKNGQTGTGLRSDDERGKPLRGLTAQRDLHRSRFGPLNAFKPPQAENLGLGWSLMPVWTVVLDAQSLPGDRVDLSPYQPIRITCTRWVSIDRDVRSTEPDARIGFDHEDDGKRLCGVWLRLARC